MRAGLPIQELAFLGRRKSNVVLTYAEEALQERAVFVPDLHGSTTPPVAEIMKAPSQPPIGPPRTDNRSIYTGVDSDLEPMLELAVLAIT